MKFNSFNINHQPLSEYLGKNYKPNVGEKTDDIIIPNSNTGLSAKITRNDLNVIYNEDMVSFVEYPEGNIFFSNDGIYLILFTMTPEYYVQSEVDDAGNLILKINR